MVRWTPSSSQLYLRVNDGRTSRTISERHSIRNRREIKEAIWSLIEKVNGHGFGFSTLLIEQSSKLQIDDPKITEEFDLRWKAKVV